MIIRSSLSLFSSLLILCGMFAASLGAGLGGEDAWPSASEGLGDMDAESRVVRDGAMVGYSITTNTSVKDVTRYTNLTFDGRTSFVRKDAEQVEAYRIRSESPAFTSTSLPVGAKARWPEYDRPRTELLFDSARLDYLALRPDGPRENTSFWKPLVRSYWYPTSEEGPSFLPRVDPPLFLGLAPLHLGFTNRTYEHWNGLVQQNLSAANDGLVVEVRTVDSASELEAVLVYDDAPFPLRGQATYAMYYEGLIEWKSWRFERTFFSQGTGEMLSFGDAPAMHERYEGPTVPLLDEPLHFVGPSFWHPGEAAFGTGYKAALASAMRHPHFQPILASSDELILRSLTWDRYADPRTMWPGIDLTQPGDQMWRVTFEGYSSGEGTLENSATVWARSDGTVEPLTLHSSTFPVYTAIYDRSDLPSDYQLAPVEHAVERFPVVLRPGGQLDLVQWRVEPWFVPAGYEPRVYWKIASGCDPHADVPSTVVLVDAATLEARFAFYEEPYGGWNACNEGVIPPLY